VARLIVNVQFVSDNGDVLWGTLRDEVIIPPAKLEESEEHMLEVGQKTLDWLDAAKESISGQIAATARTMRDD
jgi:hypothetical protein